MRVRTRAATTGGYSPGHRPDGSVILWFPTTLRRRYKDRAIPFSLTCSRSRGNCSSAGPPGSSPRSTQTTPGRAASLLFPLSTRVDRRALSNGGANRRAIAKNPAATEGKIFRTPSPPSESRPTSGRVDQITPREWRKLNSALEPGRRILLTPDRHPDRRAHSTPHAPISPAPRRN
jgi:hypothetical protein